MEPVSILAAIAAAKEVPAIVEAIREGVVAGKELGAEVFQSKEAILEASVNRTLEIEAEKSAGKELTTKEVGDIGERLFRIEQEIRGARSFAEQVRYSDLITKSERIVDCQFNRPLGSSYQEFVPRNGGRLVERTVWMPEKVVTEVKNWSVDALERQAVMDSHLVKQLNAMKEGFPQYKVELALPRDTLMKASSKSMSFLEKLQVSGVRITTLPEKVLQSAHGLKVA